MGQGDSEEENEYPNKREGGPNGRSFGDGGRPFGVD